MSLAKQLLSQIEVFLTEAKMPPTVFGCSAMGDPNFVFELRKGRRVWPETAEKAREFMGGVNRERERGINGHDKSRRKTPLCHR